MRRAALLLAALLWQPLLSEPRAVASGSASGSAPAQKPLPDTAELERELQRFVGVYAIASEHAAEPVDLDSAFYRGAIPGMLRQLDPHSVFFDRDQFQQLREMERSVTKGFGSVVSILPGRVIVLQTMPGTPSQKSGLAPGDEIVVINGYPLARLDMDQLVQLLGQSRQREAHLYVRRQGTAKLLPVTLVPEELQSPSVDRGFLLQPGIGYVRATSFDADTATRIREAIESLGGPRLNGLVLDLRDNPGGVLQAGLATAALFLKPGARILSAHGRGSGAENVDVPQDSSPYAFPLAVLVNARTGSASEIVAGAIQDHDRGAIIGQTTFGKGLVQRVFPLSDATGLALTTAFYYTPSGRSIQKPLRDSELAQATATTRPEFKTDGGRLVRGGGGIEPDQVVQPPAYTRFRTALEGSGSFAGYATEWLSGHRADASRDLGVTPAMLDDFQLWLSRRNIRPNLSDWTAEREAITWRLKQEILNQSISVAAGDEIELRHDPAVRRALASLTQH
ncbi:MAG: S41 family peptidase [Candidatus Solibacter usitatus]|nr:S41 family peptidase [Candidatus Solibacter usitatus]